MTDAAPSPALGRGHGHPGLHRHPPLTPAGVLLAHRITLPLLGTVFVALAATAIASDGRLLRIVDEPVTEALIDLRSGPLDGIVKALSSLGGITVVALVLVLLLLLVWHKCRALAFTLLVASAARPLLEWTLKAVVDRPRPAISRLVPGEGPSFPSGHVMAAVAIWGLSPPVMALVSNRRRVWWWSVGLSGGIVMLVAFSRVYLGVHWMSDVVAALLLGAFYLLAVEWFLNRHHQRRPCPALHRGLASPVRVRSGTPVPPAGDDRRPWERPGGG